MSTYQAMQAIEAKLRADNLTIPELRNLADMIHINDRDQDRRIVGGAIESVLTERFKATLGDLSCDELTTINTNALAEDGTTYKGGLRSNRATCTAITQILWGRHPGVEPIDTFDRHNPDGRTWAYHERITFLAQPDCGNHFTTTTTNGAHQ